MKVSAAVGCEGAAGPTEAVSAVVAVAEAAAGNNNLDRFTPRSMINRGKDDEIINKGKGRQLNQKHIPLHYNGGNFSSLCC
jgi:hypothetical protein